MHALLDLLDCSNNQDRKCWMKCCLIHEMLRCIYAHLVLEVGQCNLDNSFHISYISIENFWFFVISYLKVSYFYLHISALSLSRWLLLQAHSSSCFCCNRKRVLMKLRQMDEWTDGQKLLLFSFALPYLSIYHTHTHTKFCIDKLMI